VSAPALIKYRGRLYRRAKLDPDAGIHVAQVERDVELINKQTPLLRSAANTGNAHELLGKLRSLRAVAKQLISTLTDLEALLQ
jgi:hypothetical protein